MLPTPLHDFFAFISYKRGEKDEYYARWLQKKLESYRIPTEIAQGHEQALPKRLKVFRDKSDLGSHANLQDGLTKSLGQSRFLIVICSPRSAESPYVDAEVRYFLDQGRAQHIIPFIIDGTPAPKEGERQCYPHSLTADVLGITLAEGTKEEALIKTVARLLQVDFPKLYQRHLRAQRRFMLRVATGLACVLALVAGLAAWAWYAEQRATEQRKEAEGLVRFMTFDLRDEAFDYIPLRARQKIMDKVEQYYNKWGVASAEFLYTQAVHQSNQAKNAAENGNLDEAAALYHQALARVMDLLIKTPNNPALLHDAATAYGALGALQNLQGRHVVALASYQRSLEFFRACVQRMPAGQYDTKKYSGVLRNAADLLQNQGQTEQAAVLLEELRQLMGQTQNAPASDVLPSLNAYDILAKLCDAAVTPDKATRRDYCRRTADMALQLYAKDPQSFTRGDALLHSQFTVLMDDIASADFDLDMLTKMKDFAHDLAQRDPDNNMRQFFAGTYEGLWAVAMAMANQGDVQALHKQMRHARERVNKAVQKEPNSALFQMVQQQLAVLEELVFASKNDKGQADVLAQKLAEAKALAERNPHNIQLTENYAGILGSYVVKLIENKECTQARGFATERVDVLKKIYTPQSTPSLTLALAKAYRQIGEAEYCLHEYNAADKNYANSMILLEKLPDSHVQQSGFHEIAYLLDDMVRIRMAQGEYASAMPLAQRALALQQKNYQQNKKEVGAGVSYIISAITTVNLISLLGQEQNVLTILKNTVPVAEQLAAKPNSMLRGTEAVMLAIILAALADSENTTGNAVAALPRLQRALQILDPKHHAASDAKSVLNARMYTYWGLLRHYMDLDDMQHTATYTHALHNAAQAYAKESASPSFGVYGLAIQGFLVANQSAEATALATQVRSQAQKAFASEKNLTKKMEMAGFFVADAQLLLATQRFDEAEQTLAQIEPVLQLLLERCPANVNAKQYVAEAYIVRGDSALHKGDMPKAQAAYAKSCKELEALLRVVPGHVRWKKLLATAQNGLEKSRK